jgi:hypothetical protein
VDVNRRKAPDQRRKIGLCAHLEGRDGDLDALGGMARCELRQPERESVATASCGGDGGEVVRISSSPQEVFTESYFFTVFIRAARVRC